MAYHKCASIYGTNNSAASVQTASGAIANFNTKLAMPIKSLEVDVNAVQESGTPTPSTPKAISGVSEVKVGYVDMNQLANIMLGNYQGISVSMNDNGVVSINGTTTISFANVVKGLQVLKDHVYIQEIYVIENPNNVSLRTGFFNASYSGGTPPIVTRGKGYFICKVNATTTTSSGIAGFSTNTNLDGVKIQIKIIDITQALGSKIADYLWSLTSHGLSIINQIFTKDYYPYNVGGTKVTVDSVNGEPTCPNAVIELGGTYYGGRLLQDKDGHRRFEVTHKKYVLDSNLTTSSIEITLHDNYTQISYLPYILEGKENSIFKCDKFIYKPTNVSHGDGDVWNSSSSRMFFGLPNTVTTTTEAIQWFTNNTTEIVAELATTYTIDLPDGEPITTLIGTNNIYADTGDTKVSYKKLI